MESQKNGCVSFFLQICAHDFFGVIEQGSPLPRANFANDVGYLPDGTPMNRAGNALNHPDPWPPFWDKFKSNTAHSARRGRWGRDVN